MINCSSYSPATWAIVGRELFQLHLMSRSRRVCSVIIGKTTTTKKKLLSRNISVCNLWSLESPSFPAVPFDFVFNSASCWCFRHRLSYILVYPFKILNQTWFNLNGSLHIIAPLSLLHWIEVLRSIYQDNGIWSCFSSEKRLQNGNQSILGWKF